MKRAILLCVVGLGMFLAGMAVGQQPEEDIGPRHPNLRAAQQFCRQAFDAISAAQQANEGDLGGHAQRAKEYLDRASHELKEAARYAREHGR